MSITAIKQPPVHDERFAVAEEAIAGAFFVLCKEKAPDKITVADITKRAGIVRSTFYNHYTDMPTLISAMETRVTEDIFSLMQGFKTGGMNIYHAYFLGICNYALENGFLLWHLRTTASDSSFLEKFILMFHRYARNMRAGKAASSPEAPMNRDEAYALAYSIGGVLGIMHKWSVDGCVETPQTVAAITSRVFLHGMHPFIGG